MKNLRTTLNEIKKLVEDETVLISQAFSSLHDAVEPLPDDELKKWLDFEINGYLDELSVPEYRVVSGRIVMARDEKWHRIALDDEEVSQALSTRTIAIPLVEIEALLQRDKGDIPLAFNPAVEEFLTEMFPGVTLCLLVAREDIQKIYDTVRQVIRKWVTKLCIEYGQDASATSVAVETVAPEDEDYLSTTTQSIPRDSLGLPVDEILARMAQKS